MKFTTSSQAFLKELQLLSGVIGTNSVLPILEDFLLQLEGNKLRIFTSDLETSMSTILEVEGSEDGEIAIPSKILLETLKALPEQPLDIEINNDTFTVCIVSSNGKYNLIGESGEDFPNIPEPSEVKEVGMNSELFEGAIKKTLFAVSNDDLRPAMTGVNIELTENGAIFVATDAHKLVKYKNSSIKSDTYTSFIVPKKAMGLLRNVMSRGDDDVKIAYNDTNAFFNIGKVELICRLIDGKFPDYNAVIPVNNPHTLTMDRKDFERALNRISLYSSRSTYQVKLNINKTTVALLAEDRDFSNEAYEQLNCEYDGEPMEIAFNAKFLAEVLNVLDSDQVSIKLSTPSRAGLILPSEKSEDEDILMLVMPIMMNVNTV